MPPSRNSLAAATVAAIAALAAPVPVQSAESFDNCVGFIDALPAVITTQGVWCLRHDLGTAIASGTAIGIAVNNVTLDCNGFKVGNLAAGPGTQAAGIVASGRMNAVVRDCNLRGFRTAIELQGAGHLVEDVRVEASRLVGIVVAGDGSAVRRNRVIDTGGVAAASAIQVFGAVDVEDNLIDTVTVTDDSSGPQVAVGIYSTLWGPARMSGNQIRGLSVPPDSPFNRVHAIEIADPDARGQVDRNLLMHQHLGRGVSIGLQTYSLRVVVRDNTLDGFKQAWWSFPVDGGGNLFADELGDVRPLPVPSP